MLIMEHGTVSVMVCSAISGRRFGPLVTLHLVVTAAYYVDILNDQILLRASKHHCILPSDGALY